MAASSAGLGSVLGDGNTSTFTYTDGGAAAGLDYRFDPRFLVGLSVGYAHGTQWVNSFMGQGWSDTVSVAAYGSFTQARFYADVLAGYAWSNNQLQRQIVIPNLQPRNGSAGASQFLGQAETGYKLGIYAPAQASLTPFARLQATSVTQNASSESGANSPSLNVAQQGTNSLRSTIGAELAGELPLGGESKLALALRLWAGCRSSTTPAGRSAPPSSARRATASPCAAPCRRATAPCLASRPARPSPRRPRSTCATTARSAAAPTTTPSISACA
jgi:outer membrane autotransporter protein